MWLDAEDARQHTRRLFFALWPDGAVRDRLTEAAAQLRKRFRARWVPPDHFHITLSFLGEVPEGQLPLLMNLQPASAEAFLLVLDRLDVLVRRRMIWLAPEALPPALERLVGGLREHLDECLVQHDRRPFRAHLTLARNLSARPGEPLAIDPIRWNVRSLALVESEPDPPRVRYRVLRTWPLQAMPERVSME